jgi:hypothetical protein
MPLEGVLPGDCPLKGAILRAYCCADILPSRVYFSMRLTLFSRHQAFKRCKGLMIICVTDQAVACKVKGVIAEK